jgi:uncharacterized protein (DUF1786 family)
VRILAIDVGTGTQDILLLDTDQPVENALKLVLPSPTQIAAHRIRSATRAARPVVLTGVTMGGGPCAWAADEHLRHGLPAYATPGAARTFNDDLAAVERMGIRLVSEDEAKGIAGAEAIELRDLDLAAIRAALAPFGVSLDVDGLALGCLDHGEAPPGESDRTFRFDHIRRMVEARNDLLAFACRPEDVPGYLTRARALLSCVDLDVPVAFLDTGPAAALGALQDPQVQRHEPQLVLNLGNMHALAFHLTGTHIHALYEHHTGLLSAEAIERMTVTLVAGTLSCEEVFAGHGHGVYYADGASRTTLPPVAVIGPRWNLLRDSALAPYRAAPHGDMMLAGCFGMVQAFGACYPDARDAIERALDG